MDESANLPDEDRGLYPKYLVGKIPETGEIPDHMFYENNNGQFTTIEPIASPCMVLKFNDPDAQEALFVYANLKRSRYPKLADDIREQITQAVERRKIKELDAQIERLHGPGAVKAIEAAYADGSIFADNLPVRCPECASGKHFNCTGQAMLPDTDDMVVCSCKTAGHPDGT